MSAIKTFGLKLGHIDILEVRYLGNNNTNPPILLIFLIEGVKMYNIYKLLNLYWEITDTSVIIYCFNIVVDKKRLPYFSLSNRKVDLMNVTP